MSRMAWSTETIRELSLGKPHSVQTGPFGSQLHAEDYVDDGVPFVLIRNIGDHGLREEDLPRISHRDAERLGRYRLEPGDIVFSRVGRTGSCFLVSEYERGWVISGQTLRLRIDSQKIDPKFLLYSLRSRNVQNFVATRSVGTTRESLNTGILYSIPIDHPSICEQQYIAEILSTLDMAIESTEAMVTKMQRVKAGLMHNLFTRGVTADGQLRPPREETPQLYKESHLGWIPKEWGVEELANVVSKVTDGSHQAVVTDEAGDIPFLYVSCIRENKIHWNNAARISSEVYRQISPGRTPKAGVILYTAVGSYGFAALVRSNDPFAFQRHIAYIDASVSAIDPGYLAWLLNAPSMRRCADRVAEGNAQKTITLKELSRLLVTRPDPEEQKLVARIIDNAASEIAALKHDQDKLRLVKNGLMHDLLTGRKNMPEAAHTNWKQVIADV